MLTRSHAAPFLHVSRGVIHVDYLADADGKVALFLDRLCQLVRRLEGWPRASVIEALRRQERRVRDATRLAGMSKVLVDACEFRAPDGAARAIEIRREVFRARGKLWPPVPGDEPAPYALAAAQLDSSVTDMERLLYADSPDARVLTHAPELDGRALLARYNQELARAVLLDAERMRITARGGWRGIFRALKAARLMYTVTRAGRSHRIDVTGPAAAFIVRPTRYGARLARVMTAVARAPGWRIDADILHNGETVQFAVSGTPRAAGERAPVGTLARRAKCDSRWEHDFAKDFRKSFGAERNGWHLSRETTPIVVGDELFLPDFTLRHGDGREALVEIVGFWTPEYLETKTHKIAAARLDNLILVVYRGLAVGPALDDMTDLVGAARVVWFTDRPRAAPVVRAAEDMPVPCE